MASPAPAVGHGVKHFLAHFLDIIFVTEMMHVHVFAALVGFGGKVAEIHFLGGQMTIYALDAESVFVAAMRGEFPALVGGAHLMALAAAIGGFGDRRHGGIKRDKAEQGKGEPDREGNYSIFCNHHRFPKTLIEHFRQIGLGLTDGFDAKLLHQDVKDIGADKSRQ